MVVRHEGVDTGRNRLREHRSVPGVILAVLPKDGHRRLALHGLASVARFDPCGPAPRSG